MINFSSRPISPQEALGRLVKEVNAAGQTGGVKLAFVDVNEEGTEAAAVTAVLEARYREVKQRPVVFNADHPFLFLIRDEITGAWLFFGRVSNINAN